MITCILNVEQGSCRVYRRIRDNYHNVRIGRKAVNERPETRIAHFHALKLRLGLAATQFELFHNV